MAQEVVLYVGCGLTQAPESFKQEVEAFKAALRLEGFKVLEFVGLQAGTPLDVWNHDLSNVDSCTHMIGIVNENSTGLGIELGRARWYKNQQKPVLCLENLQISKKVTRMIPGGADAGEYDYKTFFSWDQAVRLVKEFVARHPIVQTAAQAAE